MLKKILDSLFHPTAAAESVQTGSHNPAAQKEPLFKLGNGFYWEFDEVPNGYGGYKVVNAYLLKTGDPTFKRCIINQAGYIQNFPGFKDRSWEKRLDVPSCAERVMFAFWIFPYQNGKALVRWLIQPDGRYFEDEDGYGAEHCDEIEMYSALNEDGQFTEPFALK